MQHRHLYLTLLALGIGAFFASTLKLIPGVTAGGAYSVMLDSYTFACDSLTVKGRSSAPQVGVRIWDSTSTESGRLLVDSFSANPGGPLFPVVFTTDPYVGKYEGSVSFPTQPSGTPMLFQLYGAWDGGIIQYTETNYIKTCVGPQPSPSPSPSPSPTPVPSPTPTPTPSPSPTPTPAPALGIFSVYPSVLKPTSATIYWETTSNGTSQVVYGKSATSLTMTTPLNSMLVHDHFVNLTGLTKKTTYYYKVLSKNADGVEYSSSVQTLKTPLK